MLISRTEPGLALPESEWCQPRLTGSTQTPGQGQRHLVAVHWLRYWLWLEMARFLGKAGAFVESTEPFHHRQCLWCTRLC